MRRTDCRSKPPFQSGAEILLVVPQGSPEARAVTVVRLRVDVVSTLPRGGHVIICPQCEGMRSEELS